MPTVIDGDFEWDSDKAARNLAQHGVSFEEAATAFADPAGVYLDDGSGGERLWLIGMSASARVLVVVHIERGARWRIISARPTGRAERELYGRGG